MISSIPPPPPLASPSKLSLPVSTMKTQVDGCLWAQNYPDIQKGCYLSQICILKPPKACKFKNIPSIIQQGPTCGLTCISMLIGGAVSPYEILELAKNYHYTINGEMFSAKNLCDILQKVINKEKSRIMCQLHEGPLNCSNVEKLIIDGATLFVPISDTVRKQKHLMIASKYIFL